MAVPVNEQGEQSVAEGLAVLADVVAALLAAVNAEAGAALPARLRGHCQSGGARIPGTSIEATPASAAEAMAALLQGLGDTAFVQRFAEALAQHDAASRAAPRYGQDGPLMAEMLAVCAPRSVQPAPKGSGVAADAVPAIVLGGAGPLAALASALQFQFRPEEVKRVLACFENSDALAAMPVSDFVALLVRL